MKTLCGVVALLSCAIVLQAAEFQGVQYAAPAGWRSENSSGNLGFVPNDVTPETGTVMALGPAENLSGSFETWLQQKLTEELQDGSKVLQASEPEKQQQGNITRATLARVVEDPQGTTTLRVYHALTDGKKAAIAMAMSVSQEAAQKYQQAMHNFFYSLNIANSSAAPATSASERVPSSQIVNGVPQGIFIGRSLLSGKAVCLLFLSGGRITRAIPEKGLDDFDWAQHQSAHSGDSGRWEIRGNQLSVSWGDGGRHQGPLTVTSDGIEFYGKRYVRPTTVDIAAVAGKWESARGTAVWGGEGIMMTQTLVINRDGSFQWEAGDGGTVAGRAVYNSTKNMTGKVKIYSGTITFYGNDGVVESYTFLPVPGQTIVAFTLGSNTFTRTE